MPQGEVHHHEEREVNRKPEEIILISTMEAGAELFVAGGSS